MPGGPGLGFAGRDGAAGPPGINWRGAHSVATAYAARDGVTWAGSSYVALAAVAAGGARPAVDAANWLKIAGGGRIAYAETLATLAVTPQATFVDVPGCSIVVPANSGPITLTGVCSAAQIVGGAAAVAGEVTILRLLIVDELGNSPAHSFWREVQRAASENRFQALRAERELPNVAIDKTYKLQGYVDSLNAGHETVNLWAGSGAQSAAASVAGSNIGPMFIRATSA